MTPEEAETERKRQDILRQLRDNPLMTNRTIENVTEVNSKGRAKQDPGTFGGKSWDEQAQRYQQMGAAQSAPIALDQAQADQAREYLMGSVGLLRDAANGRAPSQAAIQARLGADQAHAAGLASAAGARGPGAAVAAMRGAIGGTQAKMFQGAQASAEARNREAATDQAGLISAAAGVRGQDIGAAATNAELEARRRALQDQNEQAFERLGFNVRKTQLGHAMETDKQFNDSVTMTRRANDAEVGRGNEEALSGAKTAVGGMVGVSDVRAKRDIYPVMGSLSGLRGSR